MSNTLRNAFALTVCLGLAPLSVQADTGSIPFTYAQFEASVSHLDLETCPTDLPQENTFCRAAIHHEEFHIFAFSYDGDSPLVGFATYEADGLDQILN